MISNRVRLSQRARISGACPALCAEGRSFDYAELADRVSQTESGLERLGVGVGDVVAVLLENGLAFAEILHAVAERGAVLLPLNVRLTPRELAFQLEESAARLLVCAAGPLADLARESAQRVGARRWIDCVELDPGGAPALAGEISARAQARVDGARIDPAQTFALVYSSGTSGSPKGALLSHRSLFWSAIGSGMRLGVVSADRWLVCMPLFHVGGFSILLRCALFGSAAIVHERFDAERVNRALDEDGVTLVSLVPTMLERVLAVRGDRRAPPGLRGVLLGGGPARHGLIQRARSQGFPVAASYGLTEAASQVATQLPTLEASQGAIGLRPIFGTQIETVDEDGKPVREQAGEILVRGSTLMNGYSNRPEASAKALRDGWLHTGDIGVIDASGALEVLDRRCDLIISGGENIYPSEVERALLEHPSIAEAAVAGRADAEYGQRPIAWLVATPGKRLDVAELCGFFANRLAGYKIPVAFTVVDELPRNSAGKLMRERIA